MLPPTPRPWTRFSTSILLIATALAGSSIAAAPAHAVPVINCSTLVGSISTDVSFNAAAAQVNGGYCNVIDIASGFTFDIVPTVISAAAGGSLTITGPTNPADDSVLNGNGRQGLAIWIIGSDLNLTVSRLTFSNFDDTIGPWETAFSAATTNGNLSAAFSDVAFIGNSGGVMAGGLHLDSSGVGKTTVATLTGRVTFTDNTSASFESGALWADNSNSTLTLGTPEGDDTITFARNTSRGASGGSISGNTITTYGGTFTDDSAALTGGSIYATGNVTLNGTNFTGNTASGNEGGAVHSETLITITGGTFHGNRATSTNGAGGAVSASGDLTTSQITDATFTNNSSGGHGGAIRTLGRLTVTGSTFRDDSSGLSGGAIAGDDTITVTNSLFQDDTAAGSGGAIISIYASVDSEQSTYSGGSAEDNGGAISAGLGRVTSADDTFTGNRTTRYDGGAIAAVSMTATGSRFTNNRAERNGGAVSAATVDDTASTFTGNRAGERGLRSDRGGAIDTHTGTFTNSVFRDDSAPQGGAIFSAGPLTVTSSLFEDDTATVYGGAIAAFGTLSVNSSTFRRNVALETGGAIFVDDTTTIVNSVFESNEARGPDYNSNGTGGAVNANGTAANGPVTVTGSTFTSNRAAQEGGAISAARPVVLTDDTFANNASLGWSGGAVDVGITGSINVTSSAFSGNTSVKDGGAIRVDGPATITSSVFTGNRSTEDTGVNGGALSAAGDVVVTESDFTSNRSTQWGGAVHTSGSAMVTDSTFDANTTASSGGALYIDDTATITSSTFTDDTSAQLGGAITVGDLVMQASSFDGNRSGLNGGAIFVRRTADVTNSTFVDNYGGFGGAMAFNGSASLSRVAYSTFIGNTAPATQGTVINAPNTTPIALTGSVFAGAAPLCRDEGNAVPLNLTADAAYSFATDTSCGGSSASTSINTAYTTDDSLGMTATITTDDTPGMQVVVPDDTSVVNSYVPVSVLPSITTDQLGAPRNSPNGLTSAGAIQVRPISVDGPASVTVAAGSNATFSVTGYPGIGPAITYQWQRSTDGTTWTPTGGDASTLTLPSVTQADSGLQVRVLVSDNYGNDDTSTAATLTVSSTPTPTPENPPSAPGDPVATTGIASATVTWTAPRSSGSFPVTTYQVRNDVDSKACLVPASAALECTLTGLTDGRPYRFSVRALNGAGWGPWSAWSQAVTPQPLPVPTITIIGTREGRVVAVTGTTTHLVDQSVRAMVRLPGQAAYSPGAIRPVERDGTFTWQRRTAKKVYAYFTHGDVRSNRVVIPAR